MTQVQGSRQMEKKVPKAKNLRFMEYRENTIKCFLLNLPLDGNISRAERSLK